MWRERQQTKQCPQLLCIFLRQQKILRRIISWDLIYIYIYIYLFLFLDYANVHLSWAYSTYLDVSYMILWCTFSLKLRVQLSFPLLFLIFNYLLLEINFCHRYDIRKTISRNKKKISKQLIINWIQWKIYWYKDSMNLFSKKKKMIVWTNWFSLWTFKF